jgi:DNA-binding MarR family transcriptional regulator
MKLTPEIRKALERVFDGAEERVRDIMKSGDEEEIAEAEEALQQIDDLRSKMRREPT